MTDGDHQPPPQTSAGIPFLVISNVASGELSFSNTRYVSKEYYDSLSPFRKAKAGDLLFTVTGSYGIPIPVNTDMPFCFQRHIAIIRPCIIDHQYLAAILGSMYIKKLCDEKATGIAQKTVDLSTLRNFLLPVAPTSEQERILAVVNTALETLSKTKLSADALKENALRVKAKILDLAIRGKLVPQDPADEPASVLLERIRADKEEQIKAGKLKRDKKESFIFRGEDNSYYLKRDDSCESLNAWDFGDLPNSWCICLLGEVCDYGNCINVDSESIADGDWVLDLEDIEKDTGKVITRVTKRERDAASTKHKFNKGQVLYSKLRPYLNKVVLADGDGYCTSEIIPLEFAAEVHPAYARYYLMSPTFLAYANRCSYGVKMPRLSTEDGRTAAFIIPPYREQVRIAERITSIFEKIDLIQNEI